MAEFFSNGGKKMILRKKSFILVIMFIRGGNLTLRAVKFTGTVKNELFWLHTGKNSDKYGLEPPDRLFPSFVTHFISQCFDLITQTIGCGKIFRSARILSLRKK